MPGSYEGLTIFLLDKGENLFLFTKMAKGTKENYILNSLQALFFIF
jgi:hypothetical protein